MVFDLCQTMYTAIAEINRFRSGNGNMKDASIIHEEGGFQD